VWQDINSNASGTYRKRGSNLLLLFVAAKSLPTFVRKYLRQSQATTAEWQLLLLLLLLPLRGCPRSQRRIEGERRRIKDKGMRLGAATTTCHETTHRVHTMRH